MTSPGIKNLLLPDRGRSTLYIDFETRSECDLKRHGAWNYAKDPSTEVLCMAWKIDDGPVNLWEKGQDFPQEVIDHALNGGLVEAHNAFFEYVIWHFALQRTLDKYNG